MGDEPLPEVSKALIEDAPRVIRLTIWGLIAFVGLLSAVGAFRRG